jgi:hypothetical protein
MIVDCRLPIAFAFSIDNRKFEETMMNSKQMRIVTGIIVFVLLACLICPWLLSSREPALPQIQIPMSFTAKNAHRLAREFVTQSPKRVFGTLESRQSTGFLNNYLAGLGYIIDFSHFDARISGRTQAGRNILAYKQGQTPEILVLIAHYDTARTTLQGAMDNGAAVGVQLELARIFSLSPTHRSLLFVFSDGEEWGMLGAKDLALGFPDRNRIAAVLSLDGVGIGNLKGFFFEETGQLKGFTPPWLRSLARNAVEAQGLPVIASSPLQEHVERAMLISWADQGPFLAAGIPAINLGSESTDRVREKAIYHSAQDSIENIKEASVEEFGLTAERLIRMLDALPFIPRESSSSFKLWGDRYTRPGVISLLHIIVFLPLPVIFYFHLKNQSKQGLATRIGRELLTYGGTLIPLLALYFGICLVRAMRLFPFYSLYPATSKDPVLANPPWNLIGGIFGAVLFIAIVCFVVIRYFLLSWPKPDFHSSKLTLLGLMTFTVALALCYNSYWAATFLLLPAWIWALVGCHRSWGNRIRNIIWILAAGIPYYAVLGMYAARLQLSWNFVWYQVLALNTGLFSGQGYLLGIAIISIGIRLLAIQPYPLGKSGTGNHGQ